MAQPNSRTKSSMHLAKDGVLLVEAVQLGAGGDVELAGICVLDAACHAHLKERHNPACGLPGHDKHAGEG